MLIILSVSLVACNLFTPDKDPEKGGGSFGDLSEEEVLGEGNIDTSLQSYSKDVENKIYEAYKAAYLEYADFCNKNMDAELDTNVPAYGQLDATTKAALGMVRDTLRDSYISENAVISLCDYIIEKAPDVKNKAQSVLDDTQDSEDENESSWLDKLYTTDNVTYISDLYTNLVRLTGAEPISRIVFQAGKLIINESISNINDNISERTSKRTQYLAQIGMSLEDFNKYGEAEYNYDRDSYRYEDNLREQRNVPDEWEIEHALENGYINQATADELYAQNALLEAEIKQFRLQERAKAAAYEIQYPALTQHINEDGVSYYNHAYYHYYYDIKYWQEDLDYLNAVSELLSSDSVIEELMPDAINTTMSLLQIAPSIIEMRLTATALTNDIIDEITNGEIESFESKKQDYITNFATYKGAMVKLVECYEDLNWDSLIAVSDKLLAYYENGSLDLPDDAYHYTSRLTAALRPMINAVKGKDFIGSVIEWARRAIEAVEVDDLDAMDYPTRIYNGDLYDYAMTTKYDWETGKTTIYVRVLPERMDYYEMRYENDYDYEWVLENPTKTFSDTDAFNAWAKSYGKDQYESRYNYIISSDYKDGEYVKYVVVFDEPTALTDDEYYAAIDAAIENNTALVFYESNAYADWKKENSELVYEKYIQGYYFNFFFLEPTSEDDPIKVAVFEQPLTESAIYELLGIDENDDEATMISIATEWLEQNATHTFSSADEFNDWYTSSGLEYYEAYGDWYYDYVKTETNDTLYIVELPTRMSEEELDEAGYSNRYWIMNNATQTFELWSEYNAWVDNIGKPSTKSYYNYEAREIGGMMYIITYDTPVEYSSYLDDDEFIEAASISFPHYESYYQWKSQNGYMYDEVDEHFYVNAQEVTEEEYELAEMRMYAKALQIVARMTKDNKADIKAYINDYMKYIDDIIVSIDPLYIDYPAPSQRVTFDQVYAAFEAINSINVDTMTVEQFEEYLDDMAEICKQYIVCIMPQLSHICGW